MKFWIGLCFMGLMAGDAKAASTELDATILRERLRGIYGSFIQKFAGEWQASYEGRTNVWTWSPKKGWVCPKAEIKCSDWVPTSFKWWSSKGFLDNWEPISRMGFDFGKPKTQVPTIPVPGANPAEQVAARDDNDPFGGKKWALEAWEWKNKKGSSSRLYISLRDQKIERIDADDSVEYLEWTDLPEKAGVELARVIVEKGGVRLVLSKVQEQSSKKSAKAKPEEE